MVEEAIFMVKNINSNHLNNFKDSQDINNNSSSNQDTPCSIPRTKDKLFRNTLHSKMRRQRQISDLLFGRDSGIRVALGHPFFQDRQGHKWSDILNRSCLSLRHNNINSSIQHLLNSKLCLSGLSNNLRLP